MREVTTINRNRLRPSETDNEEHHGADEVEVSNGIQCEPSAHTCRRIAEFVRNKSMRPFMDRNRIEELHDCLRIPKKPRKTEETEENFLGILGFVGIFSF